MMKKISLPVLSLFLFFSYINAKAQVESGKTQSEHSKQSEEKEPEKPKKCIQKFKSITDTYYGVPNIFGPILRVASTDVLSKDISVSSIGPTGAKYEFLLTDKFGIGVDANYSLATVSWKESKSDANNNSTLYSYKVSSPALRSMLGFNFHYATKKRVDWYSAFKVGYYNRTFSYTSTDPNYRGPIVGPIWTWWHAAFRIESGVRIFLAPFLALNFNVGIGGGPLIASGVSSKF